MRSDLIIVVEDDPDIAKLICFHLQQANHKTEIIGAGVQALKAIQTKLPRLVILDLMLPEMDGLEICQNLKQDKKTRHIPIIIVSARGEESDIVTGLELGASDYVTKPFSPAVLMARLRNILRRADANTINTNDNSTQQIRSLCDDAFVIDQDKHEVTVDSHPLHLTVSEYEILLYMVQKEGYARTRDQILKAVRGSHIVLTSRTIDVHMAALRKKLGRCGPMIQTVRGVGYRCDPSLIESNL